MVTLLYDHERPPYQPSGSSPWLIFIKGGNPPFRSPPEWPHCSLVLLRSMSWRRGPRRYGGHPSVLPGCLHPHRRAISATPTVAKHFPHGLSESRRD
ncbi:hypothetical protein CGMCC3_g13125 [Colletotrichum fructicola]|nr:uncharacterized protein CGMCC3_g13125 [Colletotrichum fructicola]KAE9570657.1 hypothetical protein CGMCC3_g13125 [Colletotrichum fructicola]